MTAVVIVPLGGLSLCLQMASHGAEISTLASSLP